jgi:ABC-type antimicrobial peptide transport system permease subunit
VGIFIGTGTALLVLPLALPPIGQTSPRDPATLTVVVLLLVIVAIVATLWPASRASQVDPVATLRTD